MEHNSKVHFNNHYIMTAGRWMHKTCPEHIFLIKIYLYDGILSIKEVFNSINLYGQIKNKLSRDGRF